MKKKVSLFDKVKLNRGQLLELINNTEMEYLQTNYDKNSNDIGYNLGVKHGVEGLRKNITRQIWEL